MGVAVAITHFVRSFSLKREGIGQNRRFTMNEEPVAPYFLKNIPTASAVSSAKIGSILIFAGCVIHRSSVVSKFS